ncbi:hypothetical protein [Burkholderia cepacia]|uniref:hypothetical protein n=1 Tax=Burkholderia cepacia TaxID=292 RepID=UPI000AE99F8A|nr:hypothetical protein [Burkholderia cepacia]
MTPTNDNDFFAIQGDFQLAAIVERHQRELTPELNTPDAAFDTESTLQALRKG